MNNVVSAAVVGDQMKIELRIRVGLHMQIKDGCQSNSPSITVNTRACAEHH